MVLRNGGITCHIAVFIRYVFTQHWTILHHLAIWVCIIAWFLFLVLSSFFPFSVFYPLRGLWREVLFTPASYFTVLLGVGAACCIPVAAYGLRRYDMPRHLALRFNQMAVIDNKVCMLFLQALGALRL